MSERHYRSSRNSVSPSLFMLAAALSLSRLKDQRSGDATSRTPFGGSVGEQQEREKERLREKLEEALSWQTGLGRTQLGRKFPVTAVIMEEPYPW
ncbi:hypothetical protein PO909_032769 [Leuciscus waleckii]